MPNDFWFRLSTYLTLTAACGCLAYAEWELLPEVSAFAGVVVLFLIVSFLAGRRFELGLGKANLLGLVIGIAAALWVVYHVARSRGDGPLAKIGMPTALLPVIAPVLMVLIPAKLLRPKHVGDWWAMHGVAVAGVGLAAAIDDDPTMVVLMAAYAAAAAWSLVLFFYRRGGGHIPPVPGQPPRPAPQVLDPDLSGRGPRWVFARSVLWLALAVLIALPVFFVLPRRGIDAWSITRVRYEVGQSGESSVDVAQTGELEQTDEVAYTLAVTTATGGAEFELPAEQFWRARSFAEYRAGKWSRSTNVPNVMPLDPVPDTRLPAASTVTEAAEFGPTGFTVAFTPGEKEKHPVLAAPVWWLPGKSPVRWERSAAGWPRAADGSYLGVATDPRLQKYRQACLPAAADGLGKPFELVGGAPDREGMLLRVLDPAVKDELRRVADEWLDRAIADGRLPAEARLKNHPAGVTDPAHHEQIARLFAARMADGDEFTYTTDVARQDPKLDPVLDFLRNTRSGHCELYASTLVLLLRAADVRAQYVTGYKGWDRDEDGNPVIRRRMAHAWVEVLVSRPPPAGFVYHPSTPPEARGRVWQWLTLDPTSGETVAQTAAPAKSWLDRGATFLSAFIAQYNSERRQQALAAIGRYGPFALIAVASVLLARWAVRAGRRRSGHATSGPGELGWYERYLDLMRRYGQVPATGETPREFAARSSAALTGANHPAADVPPFVASKLYRARYAGQPLTAEDKAQVNDALARLSSDPRGAS
jgi:hypothetical protein